MNSETCYFHITHQVSLAVDKMRKQSLFDLLCKVNQHTCGQHLLHFQSLLKEMGLFLGLASEQIQIPRRPKLSITWHGPEPVDSRSASLSVFPSTIVLMHPLELSCGTATFALTNLLIWSTWQFCVFTHIFTHWSHLPHLYPPTLNPHNANTTLPPSYPLLLFYLVTHWVSFCLLECWMTWPWAGLVQVAIATVSSWCNSYVISARELFSPSTGSDRVLIFLLVLPMFPEPNVGGLPIDVHVGQSIP